MEIAMHVVNVDLYDLTRFEDGDLDHDETVALFQALVDSGLAWQLEGPFRPMAEALLAAGLVVAR